MEDKGRGRIEAECARLESAYTARYRGFESLPLRKEIKNPEFHRVAN